jgi:general secretion pathway protein M
MNDLQTNTPLPSALSGLRAQAAERWQSLALRDRLLAGGTLALLSLWLLWSLAISPALNTLSKTPGQIAAIDAQLQIMQRLAVEAKELRTVSAVPTAQALDALKSATARLGDKARLSIQGDRSTLNLSGVSAEQLRSWLNETRSGARIRPEESQLTRGPKGYIGTVIVSMNPGGSTR